MTDKAELLALALRCEQATGPDREIDKLIYYELLGFCPHANTVRSGAQSDTGFDCVDCGADSWGNLGKMGQRLHDKAPAYTASLDAAISLVPNGMILRRYVATRYVPHGCEVAIDWAHGGWEGNSDHSFALALCAAALRALASESSQ